ncbi:MAG TPA: endolytic transglycosylase MltG [Longimicrobiaceae bacterium]|nr:endolytic transglycosylase MltG [Longimicrobiaceae bacterium]
MARADRLRKAMRRAGARPLVPLLIAAALAACGGAHGPAVQVVVPPGSGMSAVADSLAAHRIIRFPAVFRAYARVAGVAHDIKPGVYALEPGSNWDAVLHKLATGDVVRVKVVIPEGWTTTQIAQQIGTAAQVPSDSVLPLLRSDSAARIFGVPGPTLEGYLYPATYTFPLRAPPRKMIRAMVHRYEAVWTPALRARADSLGLSERAVVTLASIVEMEAKHWNERDTIAAVYRNRLRLGMPLQADPTVQYALGSHRSRLLYSDIDSVADSPYNTYTHRGLPPGPIASPSDGSIRAVLYPAHVDYLYFVARPNGSHIFTHSLAEHNAAKTRVRRMRQSHQARG